MSEPIDLLRSWIERDHAESIAYFPGIVWYGPAWWQLAAGEVRAYDLTHHDMALLVAIYRAYEAVAGSPLQFLSGNHALMNASRAAMPWITPGPPQRESFMRFAALMDAPPDKARAFWAKRAAADTGWTSRYGVPPYE